LNEELLAVEKEEKNQENSDHETKAAGIVAPLIGVGPDGRSSKAEDEKNENNNPEHGTTLPPL
jgi:hypothetical protein